MQLQLRPDTTLPMEICYTVHIQATHKTRTEVGTRSFFLTLSLFGFSKRGGGEGLGAGGRCGGEEGAGPGGGKAGEEGARGSGSGG